MTIKLVTRVVNMTPEEIANIPSAAPLFDLQARKARAFDWLERQRRAGIGLGYVLELEEKDGPWAVENESMTGYVFGHTLLEAIEKAMGESRGLMP